MFNRLVDGRGEAWNPTSDVKQITDGKGGGGTLK
jgi:hypothetical protein